MMTEADFIRLHHRGFALRQRAASEAEWLALMSDMGLERPRAALSAFMARRNANVRENARRRPEAAVTLMERVEGDGAAFWVPVERRAGELLKELRRDTPQERGAKKNVPDGNNLPSEYGAALERTGMTRQAAHETQQTVNDEGLEKMARRIRGRAVRRTGELLKEIEPSKGGRPAETSGGTPTSLTRTDAARDAGLSKDQQVTATRVASVPADQFEEMIEADEPATVTADRFPYVPNPQPET